MKRGEGQQRLQAATEGVSASRRGAGWPAPPLAHHITMRLAFDRAIARTPAELRLAARVVLQHGRTRSLLGFRVADTHLHAVVAGSRELAGSFAQLAETSLRKRLRLPVPFERARIRAIESQRHLQNTLRYVFRQEEHHGTAFDLAHDGSSLPELLGLRQLDRSIAERVQRQLPRLTRSTLLDWLGAGDLEHAPSDPHVYWEATAAALGLSSFVGTSRTHQAARRAAAHLLVPSCGAATVAEVLGISQRSLRRYRGQPVEPALLRAIDQQARLRSALGQRASALGDDGPLDRS